MKPRHLIALLGLLLPGLLFAQDPLVEALRKYQAGELAAARTLIDEAVNGATHKNDPEAWLLRGFVYKDTYKAAAYTPEGDRAREVALNSLYNCQQLDKDSTYTENATQAYEYLVRSCFNEAARSLAEGADTRAVELFDAYREATLRVAPKTDLRAREMEFAEAWRKRMQIKTPDMENNILSLSGGNQQKALFARALGSDADIVLMDDPMRGVDYGTKLEVYNLVREEAAKGRTVRPSVRSR